ncbi:MAG: terminase large subunit domain-containing protein [Lachnospiraceae bacterium]
MPLSLKQKSYIANANHRWNLKEGAVRSGKSYVDVTAVIPMRIRDRIGKEGIVIIMGVSRDTIERNVLLPMREKYGPAVVGVINSRNIAKVCGEDVYCLGAEKVSQVAKVQGASAKYIYGDEVAKWNPDVFTMIKSRLDKPYSCFDGSFNPEHPGHWLKTFIDSDIDKYVQSYTIFDNPFLDPDFVENLCKEYAGTIYYDRYIKGLWKRAEGAIYRRFADAPKKYYCKVVERITEDIGVRQILKSDIMEVVIGVDFGGNKSGHAFVATAKTKEYRELIALRSVRHFGEYDSNDIDKLLLEFIAEIMGVFTLPIDYVYWDNAETVLGRGISRAIEDKYPEIIVRSARKERIKDRIDCTVRLMGVSRFFYTDACNTLTDALSNAVWDEKEQEDVRLDDGSTDIDSLDSFEYTFERDMKRFIEF